MNKSVWILMLSILCCPKVYMKETILVTGGAGYIGSHAAFLLAKNGYNVLVLDNFVYNQPFEHDWAYVVRGDCGDRALLDRIFTQHHIDAVMHFAAFLAVGESVQDPAKYYLNNVVNTLTLLNAMRDHGVKKFIFSSSAATYGNPQFIPLTEQHPQAPINPYGNTKFMMECLLHDFSHAYGLSFIIFRYFNAAGGSPDEQLFESFSAGVGTLVIPVALRAAMAGKPFTIFGTDYPTVDGTCIRDYIHVDDLAQAHLLALQYLLSGGTSDIFNLGTGRGYSVKEVIDVVQQVTGIKLDVRVGQRRAGDPSRLIASAQKAYNLLHWVPLKSDLQSIVSSAYQAECKRLAFVADVARRLVRDEQVTQPRLR